MAKAPLYTVVNIGKEPQLAAFSGRSEPIDFGHEKSLPLTAEEAVALAGQGFKVLGPDGKAISAKREPKGIEKA